MTESTIPTRRWSQRVLWVALLAAVGLQFCQIRSRGIDPDEFEHLHAAYLVSRGDVPYRDFFEHHGPALYYAMQPLFRLHGAELTVLWTARCAMWVCSLGTLWVTALIGRRLGGETVGLVAATLLAWTTIFQAKGIELRPDVPATLLLTMAFWLSLKSARSGILSSATTASNAQQWLVIGVLCGVAALFTQKSIVPVAGLALAGVAREFRDSAPRRSLMILICMGLSGAALWGVALGLFAAAGAGHDFIHSTIVRLQTWPLRSHRWEQLRPTLVADFTVWFAAAAELVFVVRQRDGRDDGSLDRIQTAIAVLVSVLALTWVKATYAQFYLLWFPLLTALAARRLVEWSRWTGDAWVYRAAWLAGWLLVAGQLVLCVRALNQGYEGSLTHLQRPLQSTSVASQLLPAVVLLLGGIALSGFAKYRNWPALVGLLAAIGMVHGILRDIDSALWSNRDQVDAVAALHVQVAPDETVLDGFTGYGALRPHAWYYWWINDYSLALMTDAQRGPKLLEHLQSAPPAAVLLDHDLERLPEAVTDWIRDHYDPVEPWPIYLRNDRVPRD